jgi:hypothetical protein
VVLTLVSAWLLLGLPAYPNWSKDTDAVFK